MTGRVVSIVAAALLGLLAVGASALGGGSIAHAQSPSAATKEASKHFQRGVALYGEADYRAALVEFRKAYEIAPNATVLYNIGQTYYQLQNYAAALTTLERYLAEAGNSASHRNEVEQTLEILHARVGKIAVTTSVSPCEISVDDEPTGRTPLREPLLVSIGRRKVTAACEGHAPESKFVDIAAGDTAPVPFSFAQTGGAIGSSRTPADTGKPANWATRLWISTGVLGATSVVFGVLAFQASRDLKSIRGEGPVQPGDPQAAREKALSDKSSRVSTFSLIADIAGVATLVTGGIALKLTLSKSRSHEVSASLVPNGIQIAGSFR